MGLYAVATPVITATDTIIEVSEMNFMFVVRRELRLDDLSCVELSGEIQHFPLAFILQPRHASDNFTFIHFMSGVGQVTLHGFPIKVLILHPQL